MEVVYGSNKRVELLALWALFLVTVKIGVRNIADVGDSKTIIGWDNGDSNL